jgi:hypothetical protein
VLRLAEVDDAGEHAEEHEARRDAFRTRLDAARTEAEHRRDRGPFLTGLFAHA